MASRLHGPGFRPRPPAGGRPGADSRHAGSRASWPYSRDRGLRGPVIGALAGHPRREDVAARLVELDEHNVTLARQGTLAAGLHGIESVVGDASVTDAYHGAVPADLILLCGVFGNINKIDVTNTINHLPQLKALRRPRSSGHAIVIRPTSRPSSVRCSSKLALTSWPSSILTRSVSAPTACGLAATVPGRCTAVRVRRL